jgi:hypothetical protein
VLGPAKYRHVPLAWSDCEADQQDEPPGRRHDEEQAEQPTRDHQSYSVGRDVIESDTATRPAIRLDPLNRTHADPEDESEDCGKQGSYHGRMMPLVVRGRPPGRQVLAIGTFERSLGGEDYGQNGGVNLPTIFPLPEGRQFPDPPRCAFCDNLGRPMGPDRPESADLPRVVAGPGLYICEPCVRLCTEIFQDDDAGRFD